MRLYQLFTLEGAFGWQPQFSDHERHVVKDELADSYSTYPKAHTVILRLADDSADTLDHAQRMLNKHGRNIKVTS